ncbi:DUF4886 domain-containing protein [Clostridium polynesiense]|uniref:DUF4886 domain-containing protein n=1 Tax=Clostridium polynesiense TaxID=1325933 RepID=UPI000694BC27|nr:DUF4886 domain-containing protein [Clostridium polynesiense]
MNILAIGNSFSEDATKYLHQIAEADDVDINVVNLYIGGCSLETHWNNILQDEKAYEYSLNGSFEGRMASIKEVVLEHEWDFITLQQASGLSGIKESFYPYIRDISNYLIETAPNAKQIIHQTWAYEIDSTHPSFLNYNNSQENMYEKLKEAYYSVAEDLNLTLIPCGDVVQAARRNKCFNYGKGGISLCRDGYHMDFIYGRYLTAAVWYRFFTGRSIVKNTFRFDSRSGADEVLIKAIKLIVDEKLEGLKNSK